MFLEALVIRPAWLVIWFGWSPISYTRIACFPEVAESFSGHPVPPNRVSFVITFDRMSVLLDEFSDVSPRYWSTNRDVSSISLF